MKKSVLIAFGLFLFSSLFTTNIFAQKQEIDPVFTVCEESAEYIGGQKALVEFLDANMKYPPIAMENGLEGRVYLSFIVEKDGSLSKIKIIRSISKECDEEAIRLVKLMPKWKPAKQRGEPVRHEYNLPINFLIIDK